MGARAEKGKREKGNAHRKCPKREPSDPSKLKRRNPPWGGTERTYPRRNANTISFPSRLPSFLGGVDAHSHDVMIMPRQDGDALPTLPIPNPNGLIIRSGEDPRVLVVKVDGADVVEMAV